MGMDHRWGERESTDIAVQIVAGPGKTGTARVVNVSLTGAFLETSVPLRLHSLVYLQANAQAPSGTRANSVAANVVRQDDLGVGVEWCESLSKRAHIDALLAVLGKFGTATDPSGPPTSATGGHPNSLVLFAAEFVAGTTTERRP